MALKYSSYMFSVGSSHPAIRIIKQFLNEHPDVRQSNLQLTNNFDWQTANSLAEYQRSKSLHIKNGIVNYETYLAMGRDMGMQRIRTVSVSDPGLVVLLTTPSNRLDVQFIVDHTVYVSGRGGEAETPDHIRKIKDQLKKIITCDNCRQAYMDAGLPDPLKFLENSVEQKLETDDARQVGTYTITSYKGLQFDDIARGFRITEKERQALLASNNPATTSPNAVSGITGGITFIRPPAFANAQYTIEETVAHELIHGMGKPGRYYSQGIWKIIGVENSSSIEELTVKSATGYVLDKFGSSLEASAGYHDLSYMGDAYAKIINACK